MNALTTQTGGFDLSPRNFEQALTLADYLAASEMVPKLYRGKPGDCLIAMQWGMEIGLKPLQSLQSIAPINGKPNLYGDAGKALLLANGCIIDEDDAAIVKETGRARCRITRPGHPPVERTFSLEDAKLAKLWDKEGPWRSYPYRQMAWRAFWFAARDAAADLLRGMGGYDEGIDSPGEKHMGAADEVVSQPQQVAKQQAPLALPNCAEDTFAKNLPAWLDVIDKGRKTPDEIIAMAQAKYVLSDEQQRRIRRENVIDADSGEITPAHDDFVADMEAAEAQQ